MKLITAESQRKADGLRLVKIRLGVVFNLDFFCRQNYRTSYLKLNLK